MPPFWTYLCLLGLGHTCVANAITVRSMIRPCLCWWGCLPDYMYQYGIQSVSYQPRHCLLSCVAQYLQDFILKQLYFLPCAQMYSWQSRPLTNKVCWHLVIIINRDIWYFDGWQQFLERLITISFTLLAIFYVACVTPNM